jgi:hypothetical protein
MKEPQPCEKFRNVDAVTWVTHVNRDHCLECLALARYFVKESLTNMLAWRNRN